MNTLERLWEGIIDTWGKFLDPFVEFIDTVIRKIKQ